MNDISIENIIPDISKKIHKTHVISTQKKQSILNNVLRRIDSWKNKKELDRKMIQRWIDISIRKERLCFPKSVLLDFYLKQVSDKVAPYHRMLHLALIRKLGKSHSGVSVISILTSPYPKFIDEKTGEMREQQFSCKHQCVYCPLEKDENGRDINPRSYLSGEPAVSRALRNKYDTYEQFMDRAKSLIRIGNICDKVELIILGGTWSQINPQYQETFIRDLYYSANVLYESKRDRLSLEDEIKLNETARCRIIGLTLETRPDSITQQECLRLRRFNCTRVQLGVQHTDDSVLRKIKRGCLDRHTIRAIQTLKNFGFKVDIHIMPDLPGSSPQMDRQMMTKVLTDHRYSVDHHKWYPTATVPHSELLLWYQSGKYKPWAEGPDGEKKLFELLRDMYLLTPKYIRLNRIIRDIPSHDIMGGNARVSMRQDLDRYFQERGIRPREIRTREVKSSNVDWNSVELITETFIASGCKEYFISFEDTKNDTLLGFVRLRIPSKKDSSKHIVPALRNAALIRELHVYGVLMMVGDQVQHNDNIQHRGLGKRLLIAAENIAKLNGFHKTAVISGVGVRQYYAKRGYSLKDTYMIKYLPYNYLYGVLSILLILFFVCYTLFIIHQFSYKSVDK